ncbi:LysR family transcriptional regulator [Pseudenhygromyxa sp. WMMC2535]|uniref:LysR family transcriptional regulator n=1 Tax=Pseudenhygromyxa sp. WMMC2535 TaxID=2712867 RepID=UPI0015573E2F|nr:LysR family transcriptional regulator [Pseudenhygromyxa sp. WMMC2535]NVB40626.1 LysR family transcriptional regulator [Pseudenhygromyxa sp. WMMC2535]
MDWQSVAFDWNRARAFLVTAEEGTFSAAARALGVAQPTLGRQVAALEEELGVTLFERVGKGLELTAAGLELVEHVRAMSEAATRVSLAAAGQSLALAGVVRVAASEVISAYLLPGVVAELRRDHPELEIEIVAANQTTDLQRREADVAIRNFRPQGPELIARKLRDSRAWLYASPDYLARIGDPQTPEELAARAEIIGFEEVGQFIAALATLGLEVGRERFPVRSANHLVQWALVKQGVGMCAMMEEVGEPEPLVRRVLPEHIAPFVFPSWLTCHRELRTSRRIRVVFERIAARLGDVGDADQ